MPNCGACNSKRAVGPKEKKESLSGDTPRFPQNFEFPPEGQKRLRRSILVSRTFLVDTPLPFRGPPTFPPGSDNSPELHEVTGPKKDSESVSLGFQCHGLLARALELDSTIFPRGCPGNHPKVLKQKRSPRRYLPGVSTPDLHLLSTGAGALVGCIQVDPGPVPRCGARAKP